MAEHVQYEFWQGGAAVRSSSPTQMPTASGRTRSNSPTAVPAAKHDEAPLVLKIAVPPSAVIATIADLRAHDPACTIQAHAASGIIIARFANFAAADVSTVLVGKLRPAAVAARRQPRGPRQQTRRPHTAHPWGGRTDATVLMERIKHQFDPHNILNPGRFVFDRITTETQRPETIAFIRMYLDRASDLCDNAERPADANPGAALDYDLLLGLHPLRSLHGRLPHLRRDRQRERRPARPHLPHAGRHRRPARLSPRVERHLDSASTAAPAKPPALPACNTANSSSRSALRWPQPLAA